MVGHDEPPRPPRLGLPPGSGGQRAAARSGARFYAPVCGMSVVTRGAQDPTDGALRQPRRHRLVRGTRVHRRRGRHAGTLPLLRCGATNSRCVHQRGPSRHLLRSVDPVRRGVDPAQRRRHSAPEMSDGAGTAPCWSGRSRAERGVSSVPAYGGSRGRRQRARRVLRPLAAGSRARRPYSSALIGQPTGQLATTLGPRPLKRRSRRGVRTFL